MSVVVVVPTIEPHGSDGFELRVQSVDSQQVWWKWHETERNAYEDAVDLGVATEQSFGSTLRRQLKKEVSIDEERLEQFGLKKTDS
jgi:hypothetical protein